ncbi:hypothetical protein TRVA0_036S00452 [Trichomonascus vanleenenianus]|uniref:Kar5p n=1 Tax=Trichomonascus vanleenenianus TaxID=2268995 RepID=UPI003EC9AD01
MLFQELEIIHANTINNLQELVPAPASSCIQEAIMSLVPNCGDISDSDRLKYGIRLSICEFASAGIDYPAICDNEAFIRLCANQLEGKSQWWTTLSGNTRAVNVICGEYSRKTYAYQMVQAFENVSSVHRQLYRDLSALVSLQRERSDNYVEGSFAKLKSMQFSVDYLQDSIAVLNDAIVSATDFGVRKIDDDVQAAIESLENMKGVQERLFAHSLERFGSVSNSAYAEIESLSELVGREFLAHSRSIEAATMRRQEMSGLIEQQIIDQRRSLELYAEIEHNFLHLMQLILDGYNASRQDLETIKGLHCELGSKLEILDNQVTEFNHSLARAMAWVSFSGPRTAGIVLVLAGGAASVYSVGRNLSIGVLIGGIALAVLNSYIWVLLSTAIVFTCVYSRLAECNTTKPAKPPPTPNPSSTAKPSANACLELYF